MEEMGREREREFQWIGPHLCIHLATRMWRMWAILWQQTRIRNPHDVQVFGGNGSRFSGRYGVKSVVSHFSNGTCSIRSVLWRPGAGNNAGWYAFECEARPGAQVMRNRLRFMVKCLLCYTSHKLHYLSGEMEPEETGAKSEWNLNIRALSDLHPCKKPNQSRLRSRSHPVSVQAFHLTYSAL